MSFFSLEKRVVWGDAFRLYLQPKVRAMLFLGFSSGLPILLVFSSLSFWLREAGIERSTIGFISWVALAYGFKWIWSPLVDRMPLPLLTRWFGRRRGWMLLAQITIISALVGMAFSDPQQDLTQLIIFAVIVAFGSATQDIVIDAYRIERANTDAQAAMAATYMVGYRLAMILATAGALGLAAWVDPDETTYQFAPWTFAYLCMAVAMGIGLVTTLLVREPNIPENPAVEKRESDVRHALEKFVFLPSFLHRFFAWFSNAVIGPFADFLVRYRWHAVLILLLIGTYRISDIVLGVIANVFYVDVGFTKGEVATISKFFGVVMTLLGAGLGGVLVTRFGVMRILFLGALLAAATNLLFALLATVRNDVVLLTVVISVDNLSAGIATSAFIAYLSGLTNISYSATQYALFSSVMLLFPKFLGGFSGVVVDVVDYPTFFLMTALIGLPVLVLVVLAMRWIPADSAKES